MADKSDPSVQDCPDDRLTAPLEEEWNHIETFLLADEHSVPRVPASLASAHRAFSQPVYKEGPVPMNLALNVGTWEPKRPLYLDQDVNSECVTLKTHSTFDNTQVAFRFARNNAPKHQGMAEVAQDVEEATASLIKELFKKTFTDTDDSRASKATTAVSEPFKARNRASTSTESVDKRSLEFRTLTADQKAAFAFWVKRYEGAGPEAAGIMNAETGAESVWIPHTITLGQFEGGMKRRVIILTGVDTTEYTPEEDGDFVLLPESTEG